MPPPTTPTSSSTRAAVRPSTPTRCSPRTVPERETALQPDASRGTPLQRRWLRLVDRAGDLGELRRHAAAEGLHGHDGDDGDEGQEQAVLHHAGATLVTGELRLEPGLHDEQVHWNHAFRSVARLTSVGPVALRPPPCDGFASFADNRVFGPISRLL